MERFPDMRNLRVRVTDIGVEYRSLAVPQPEVLITKRQREEEPQPEAPILHCGKAEKMLMFRANEIYVNKKNGWCSGGRMQMPGVDISEHTCSILCPNMKITLKIATLKTKLLYSNEQLLFHASVDDHIKDDGNFRYFAFDPTHSANYVEEEIIRKNASTKFMHVFRVKKEIPNLAFFADTKTWSSMSGRETMLKNRTCPPGMKNMDPQTAETKAREAALLGMPLTEWEWAEHVRDFKTSSGITLNGFVSTTGVSATLPFTLVEPKFELMLKVERLTEYLEHVKCYVLEDYIGKVEYHIN
tara:strand:+ start:3674 stop:4573 length:900 start_codon:yes stop_codon:yes gene_type:complete